MDSIGLDEQDYRRTSSSEASSSSQGYTPDEVFSPTFLTSCITSLHMYKTCVALLKARSRQWKLAWLVCMLDWVGGVHDE